MSAVTERVVWKRLDVPGHDEAQLSSSGEGFVLSGSANFISNGQDCRFDYHIECGLNWQTSRCAISGFVGGAWMRFPELDVQVLDQVYTRLDANRFLYQSADLSFERILTVNQAGFVTEYPGLWTAESITS